MNALIVDDEPLARSHLRIQLEAQGVEVAGEAGNAVQALKLAEDLHPDVLFLDIQMPGMTGLQMANAIQGMDAPPLLVFVTGYSEYALSAFEHNSIDYLLKPVSADRLARTLVRARSRLQERSKRYTSAPGGEETQTSASVSSAANAQTVARLPVREDFSVRLIRIDDIVCASAREKRVYIRTTEREYRSDYTLKQLESLLPAELFFRVHDSHLVNLNLVKELHLLGGHSYAVRMENELLVPVSKYRYKDLQLRLGLDARSTA